MISKTARVPLHVLATVVLSAGAAICPRLTAAQQSQGVSRPAQTDADRLLARADDTRFPDVFLGVFRLTTRRPDGTGARTEVQAPERSRGMRFLQRNDDLRMYNPRSGSRRANRLSARDSFQGSVFSNNDVSDPNYGDDYNASHDGRERIDHPQFGAIETIKRNAVASHDEAPFRRMTLSAIEEPAGARRPRRMRMEALDESVAVTVFTVESLEARDSFPGRIFNRKELTR